MASAIGRGAFGIGKPYSWIHPHLPYCGKHLDSGTCDQTGTCWRMPADQSIGTYFCTELEDPVRSEVQQLWRTFRDSGCRESGYGVSSESKNATFQTKNLNLGMKTEAIARSNFPPSLTHNRLSNIFALEEAGSYQMRHEFHLQRNL